MSLTLTEIAQFKIVVRNLFEASDKIRELEKEFRVTCNDLAGADLSDWTIDDLMHWIDLGNEQFPNIMGQQLLSTVESVLNTWKPAFQK